MEQKTYLEKFIDKAKEKHGNKFTYEKTKIDSYKDYKVKTTFTCEIHGDFQQTPEKLLTTKHGCNKCSGKHQYTTEEFIEKSKEIYGDKFDYLKTEYINSKTNITLICKKHNHEFTQTPDSHLNKTKFACSKCVNEIKYPEENKKRIKTEEEKYIEVENTREYFKNIFIQKAKEKHNDRYDYSKVEYINNSTKVTIICPDNGPFEQTPHCHLKCTGDVYNKVANNRKNITTEDFIKKARQIHGDKFIYDKTIYKHNAEKLIVECRTHGEFLISPNNHTSPSAKGCPKCRGLYKTTEEFIKEAQSIHGEKYNYSEVEYINATTKIKIICDKHGPFYQTPNNHINRHNIHGKGCPSCQSSKNVIEIGKILTTKDINYIQEYKFNDCRNIRPLPFDFYLPKYNVCIEYDGEFHFMAVENYITEENVKATQQRDQIKNEYCLTNNIPLLRIRYDEDVEEKLTEFLKQQNII